jgi:hypothetical protein
MKKSELLKFIEDEVNQVVKSEKSKPAPKKQAPVKPKELKEEDFDEVMFKKVNESSEKIKKINKSNMEKKLNLDELKKLIKEAIETNEVKAVKAKPKEDKISFDKEKLPNLHQTLSLLKKYYVLYPNLDLETRKLTHTAKGEQLSKLLDKIQSLTKKALDIAEPIKTKTKKEK